MTDHGWPGSRNEVAEQSGDVQDPFQDRRSVVEMKSDTCLRGATGDEKQAGQGRRVEKRQPVEIEMQIRQVGLLGQ